MLIDWIACTMPSGAPAVKEWIQTALTGPWQTKDYAMRPYTCTMFCRGVSILTDAPNDESIHLIVNGSGCRELEAAGIMEDWPNFLARLLRAGAKFTRLDAAIDDHDGVLDMDDILDCCREGRVVSSFKTIMPMEELDKTTGAVLGRMVTFGKRGSDSSIRLYDKSLEQRVPGPWIRVELQNRDARAQALAIAIAEKGGDVVPSILLDCLDFKERGPTDRRDRWSTTSRWLEFVGTHQRFQLTTAPRSESIEKSHAWIMKQVTRAFASVQDSGLYPTFSEDVLAAGRLKIEGRAAKPAPKLTAITS